MTGKITEDKKSTTLWDFVYKRKKIEWAFVVRRSDSWRTLDGVSLLVFIVLELYCPHFCNKPRDIKKVSQKLIQNCVR